MPPVSRQSIAETLNSFIENYNSPPYILNIYGETGIGKTTFLKKYYDQYLKHEYELQDLTPLFNDNPEGFMEFLKTYHTSITFTGKKNIYMLRYPKLKKKHIDLLKNTKFKLILITTTKQYKLNNSAKFISFPRPTTTQLIKAFYDYIRIKNYPQPKRSKIFRIVSNFSTYTELYNFIEATKPTYDPSKYHPSTNPSDYDTHQLIIEFMRKRTDLPYYKLLSPSFRQLFLYSIISSYRDPQTRHKILYKLHLLSMNYKKYTATYQQHIVNNLIEVSPSKPYFTYPKLPPLNVPAPLFEFMKRVSPENPFKSLNAMLIIQPPLTNILISTKDQKKINQFISAYPTIYDYYDIEREEDLLL